jgi:serine/threonine-protein kinase HipA
MKVDNLTVNYRERRVGTLSLTPDNKLCVFEYDGEWLSKGFSISPLELPLRTGLFVAKPQPFYGDFGVLKTVFPMDTDVICCIRHYFVKALTTPTSPPSTV